MYEGKRGKRKYLIIEKRKSIEEARYIAKTMWHCKESDLIVGGAKFKNQVVKANEEWCKVMYVELPFDEGNYWCIWRGCRTEWGKEFKNGR